MRCKWIWMLVALTLLIGIPAVQAGSTLDRAWLATLKKNDLDPKDRNFAGFTKHLMTYEKCLTKWEMVIKARKATLSKMEKIHAQGLKEAKAMLKDLDPKKHKKAAAAIDGFIDLVTSEGGIGKMGSPEVALEAHRANTAKMWKARLKNKMPGKVKKAGKKALKIWDKFDDTSKDYDELAGDMVGFRTCMFKSTAGMQGDYKILKRWSGPDKKTTAAVREQMKDIFKEIRKRGSI